VTVRTPAVLLLVVLVAALTAAPGQAAAPTVDLTGGGQTSAGKSLSFASKTNASLGASHVVELRGVDLKRSPRSSFVQPDYKDPRTCSKQPCSWSITSRVPIDYEFRAFLVDPSNGAASAASVGVRGIWSGGAQPHDFKLFVNGRNMKLNALESVDEYLPVKAGKLRVEARWATDARRTPYSVVIASTEPRKATWATCTAGTSCLVPKLVPIGKDQEMSWTVSVLTKKGRQLVIGYQVCLVGRA